MDLDFKNFDSIPMPLKVGFIGVICAMLFYFGYMFDFSYTLRVIESNKNKENDLKTALQGLIDEKNSLQNNISDFPQLFKTLIDWQEQLIKPEQLPDLLNEILKIGSGDSLQFDLFNPGEKLKDDIYYKLPIRIIAEGNYNQLADFISQLANMKYLIAVNNFIIAKKIEPAGPKPADASPSVNTLIAEINLEVFYRAAK